MTDKQVDSLLKDIEKSDFKIASFNKNIDTENFDPKKAVDTLNKSFHLSYLIEELKLIKHLQKLGKEDLYGLTKKGRKVIRLGGWLKYLERLDDIEKKRELKEDYELRITAFQAKNQYLPYILSFCGVFISIASLFITCNSNNDEPSRKKEHTLEYKVEKTKSETKKNSDSDTLLIEKK